MRSTSWVLLGHESSGMARPSRRPGRDRRRSDDRGADRRHHPSHVDRPVRLRPPPLRGDGPVHDARATSSGTSRWASSRRSGRRCANLAVGDRVVVPFNISCGHCFMCDQGLQSQCETTQVREHGKGAVAVRLHQALRPGAGRPGRAAARPARPVRPDQGARRAARRPVRLPLRRPADGVAGRRVRRDPAWRQRRRARPRPDRRHGVPGRARTAARQRVIGVDLVPERLERARRHGVEVLDLRRVRRTRHRRGACATSRTAAAPTPSSTPSAWRPTARRSAKLAHQMTALLPDTLGREADDEGRRRPAGGAAPRDRAGPPGRHDLDRRRLRRDDRPAADDDAVRQADPAAHGPGQRASAGSTTSCRCSTTTTRSASRPSPPTTCRSTTRRTPTRCSRRSRTAW